MLDIDPRLDQKLRSLYEQIEATSPPSHLAHFDPERSRSGGARVQLRRGDGGARSRGESPWWASRSSCEPTSRARPGPPTSPDDAHANADTDGGNRRATRGPRQPGRKRGVPGAAGRWGVDGHVAQGLDGRRRCPARTSQDRSDSRSTAGSTSCSRAVAVAGRVSQRVKTVPGTNYQLIFTTGLNPACTGSAMLDVYWNGRYVTGHDDHTDDASQPRTRRPGLEHRCVCERSRNRDDQHHRFRRRRRVRRVAERRDPAAGPASLSG